MTTEERDLFDIWADLSFTYYKMLATGVPISEYTREMTDLLSELRLKAEEVKSEKANNL